MENLVSNLRYALRRLVKSPTHTLTVLACLALGLGANTSIFSVINSLLFQPLPVEDVDQLAFGLDLREGDDPFEASIFDYLELQKQPGVFSSVGLAWRTSFDLIGQGDPERLEAALVSSTYFSTLGITTAEGRLFSPEEYQPNGPRVALIGQGLWKRRFGGSESAVGQDIRLGDGLATVVGVLSPGFDLPNTTELWVPHQVDYPSLSLSEKNAHDYFLIARLQENQSMESANVAAAGVSERLAQAFPDLRRGWTLQLITLRQQLMGDIRGDIRPALRVVLFVVSFLLLIACANVASLLLVRSMERSQETALRLALGATRRDLVTQMLTESSLLGILGGALGLALAYFMTPLLMSLNPINAHSLKGFFYDVPLDGRVLLYTLVISLATGVFFGLVPALRADRPDLMSELREGAKGSSSSRKGRRWLDSLVVAEIAVAAALLVGAGLMVGSFQEIQKLDLGFEPENVLTADLYLTQGKYRDAEARAAFVRQLVEQVAPLQGVDSVGITTNIPLAQVPSDFSYTVEGAPPPEENRAPSASHRVVTPGYLEMMGMRLIEGRFLPEQDRKGSVPAMVITRAFAREAFGSERGVLGKRVSLGSPPIEGLEPFEIVGLVNDVKEDRFNFRIDRPTWYISYYQVPSRLPVSLALRTSGDTEKLVPMIRQAVRAVDPGQPIARIGTMNETVARLLNPSRFSAVMVGLFAILGLLLAAIGLYGVMTYSVGQRMQELGIRVAMGAERKDLLILILGRGIRLTLAGLAIGLVMSLLLSRWLSSILFKVGTADAKTFFGISLVILATAFLATFLPALRSTRIDPVKLLRSE